MTLNEAKNAILAVAVAAALPTSANADLKGVPLVQQGEDVPPAYINDTDVFARVTLIPTTIGARRLGGGGYQQLGTLTIQVRGPQDQIGHTDNIAEAYRALYSAKSFKGASGDRIMIRDGNLTEVDSTDQVNYRLISVVFDTSFWT